VSTLIEGAATFATAHFVDMIRLFRPLPVSGTIVTVIVALCGCAPPTEPGTGVVRRVVDGDTIELRIGRANETVRLLGIDTPETVHPAKPVECFGPEASSRATQLLPVGTVVRIQRDIEARDHFGRLLLYVFVGEAMVNEVLLQEGFGRPLSIEPNVSHSLSFARIAGEARSRGTGLWGACRQ
jgi:micrococcal nuclease